MKRETLYVLITHKGFLVLLSSEIKENINSVNIKQMKRTNHSASPQIWWLGCDLFSRAELMD